MLSKSSAIAVPLVLAIATASHAGVSTNISTEDALEGRVQIIVAAEGGGVNIDFSQTGETIRKISLDDSSRVVVDHCLITKSCGNSPEPVVRLFRANIPQKDIPAVKRTQLTILTRDDAGEWRTYIFPVTPSLKPAIYTKFVVGGTAAVGKPRQDFPTTTVLGIQEAESQSLLVDPRLKGRVKTFLRLTQAGMPPQKAAKKAGISKQLVAKLDSLGQTNLANNPPSQDVAAVGFSNPPLPPPAPPKPLAPPPSKPMKQAIPPAPSPKSKLTVSQGMTKVSPLPSPPVSYRFDPSAPAASFTLPPGAIAVAPSPPPQPVASPPPASVQPAIPKVAAPPVKPLAPKVFTPSDKHLQAKALVKGLILARRQRTIKPDVAAAVQDVISLLRSGQSMATAAKRSKVPMKTIEQLLSLAQG